MFEATAGALGKFEYPLNEYKSVQVTRVLHDFYDSDPNAASMAVEASTRALISIPLGISHAERFRAHHCAGCGIE